MSDLFSHNLRAAVTDPSDEPVKRHFVRSYLVILIGIVTPLALLVSITYFTQYDSPSKMALQRMAYLEQNPERAQTVLFGSSRVSALNIQPVFSTEVYTYYTPGGYALNHVSDLQEMINKGVVPKQVLLGLGEATIQTPRKILSREKTNDSTNRGALPSLKNLVSLPTWADLTLFWKRLKRKIDGTDFNYTRALETGRAYCYVCETEAQARSLEEHKNALSAYADEFNQNRGKRQEMSGRSPADSEAKAISTIQEIIDLTDAYNIELFVFIDPIYQEKYLGRDMHTWRSFKRKLSQLSPFLDFSNFNQAFAEPMSFNDAVHYNEALGTRLVNDIEAAIEGHPEDLELGTWITAETVDAAMEQQQQRYLQLRQLAIPLDDQP